MAGRYLELPLGDEVLKVFIHDALNVPFEHLHGEGHRPKSAGFVPGPEPLHRHPEELSLYPVAHQIGVGLPNQDRIRIVHGLEHILQRCRLPLAGEDPEVLAEIRFLGVH